MKTFLSIAILFATLATVRANVSDPDRPLVKDGYVMRTLAQDAALKQWIIGLQTQVDAAQADLKTSQTNFADAQTKAVVLQGEITDLANHDARETTLAIKLAKEVSFLKTIIGIEAAVAAVLLCLWLRVPDLSPPWGLVATVAVGPLAFGVIKLI